MNSTTKTTILEALHKELDRLWSREEEINRKNTTGSVLSSRALDDLGHIAAKRARVDAAIADIESSGATTWEPDANGLLPCPFCGGEASLDTTHTNGDTYHVTCLADDCAGNIYIPDRSWDWPEWARDAWNRRTTAQQPAPSNAIRSVLELAKLRNNEIDTPECVAEIDTVDAWLNEQGGDDA